MISQRYGGVKDSQPQLLGDEAKLMCFLFIIIKTQPFTVLYCTTVSPRLEAGI